MKYIIHLLLLSFFLSCGSSYKFKKSPIDNLIRDLNTEKNFTIILNDIDVDGSVFTTYKHQYKIITVKDSIPREEVTDWVKVDEKFFMLHENNLGMEVASKVDGKLSKTVAPAGYSNYVGNAKYGKWENRNGSSFWQFYGQYMFMSSMFNMFSPPRYGYYNDYNRNYRNANRSYYGPRKNGRSTFGTYGRQTEKARPNFFKRRASRVKRSTSSFRDRVKSKMNRSKSKRSSSRYNSRSSFRSRSGGFGK